MTDSRVRLGFWRTRFATATFADDATDGPSFVQISLGCMMHYARLSNSQRHVKVWTLLYMFARTRLSPLSLLSHRSIHRRQLKPAKNTRASMADPKMAASADDLEDGEGVAGTELPFTAPAKNACKYSTRSKGTRSSSLIK